LCGDGCKFLTTFSTEELKKSVVTAISYHHLSLQFTSVYHLLSAINGRLYRSVIYFCNMRSLQIYLLLVLTVILPFYTSAQSANITFRASLKSPENNLLPNVSRTDM